MGTVTSGREKTTHFMNERETNDSEIESALSGTGTSAVAAAVEEAERENRRRATKLAGWAVLGVVAVALIALVGTKAFGDGAAVVTSVETATTAIPVAAEEPPSVGFEEPAEPEESTEKIQPEIETPRAPDPPDVTVGDQPMALRSMGLLEIGMTVAQAEEAIGGTIVEPDYSADCHQTIIAGDPSSPTLMIIGTGDFERRRITRIDMVAGNATRSGIGIGSTKIDVITTYETRIQADPRGPDSAQGEEYLTFVPADEADSDYRIVMETSADTVTAVRNGALPWVEWVNGCE